MTRTSLLATAILVGSAWALGPSSATPGPAPSRPAVPHWEVAAQDPDSTALRRRARDAQLRFENIRRFNLPWTWSWGGGPCDEVVGRMCLRHGPRSREPEPEREVIQEARDELLEILGGIGERIPGDDWVLGQRVQYLGEAGRWHEAANVARRCRPRRPWCDALEGLALHGGGDVPGAEAAFARALAGLPPEEASEWDDPSVLLRAEARRWLGDVHPGGESQRRERVWLLADPLFLVPGNDRRAEHHARQVMGRIRERARNPYGLSWGWDLHELLLRYGWERWWERTRPEPGHSMAGGVVGHHDPHGREFMPPVEALRDPASLEPDAWRLEEERPRASHTPAHAPRFFPLDAQVARFRRGGGLLVLAAYRMPPDTLGAAADDGGPAVPPEPPPGAVNGVQAGLFLVGDRDESEVRSAGGSGGTGSLMLRAPAGGYLLSLEAWAPSEGRAARVRHGLRLDSVPDDVLTVSDLLLLDGEGPAPADLEAALPRMRPSLEVVAGEPLPVAWEVYGLGRRAEALDFRLTLGREDRGLLRRAGEWLRVVSRPEPVVLAWTEAGPEGWGPAFRAVSLELPDLAAGSYLLSLELATTGRSTVVTSRTVQVPP